MRTSEMLALARHSAGLTQQELAHRAHTSRATLSAYEHGRKSPTLATAARLLAETGHELDASPRVDFVEHLTPKGRPFVVPTRLPRLSVNAALATVSLPLHLNWSQGSRAFDLTDRAQRARLYEIVLREGRPVDILKFIDGVLLVDLWDELVLPRDIRVAWEPVVAAALDGAA